MTVDATGQAHIEGAPELPSAIVQLVDPWGNVQQTYRECDPWIVENVLYGNVRLPVPSAFVTLQVTP